MTKICPSCRQDLPLTEYYRRRNKDGSGVYCKPCTFEQTIKRQRRLKAQAIAYKGSCCQLCGYDRYVGSLEFHHRDPAQKDFSLAHARLTAFEKVKGELDKCDLLCANCHREEHARMKGLL
jgi:5-methylcytosine-specific restriction endonuclease McrA